MRSLAVVLAAAASIAATSGEFRHLRLTRSEPMADSSVTSVRDIKLWFSQAVELAVTTVRLTGEGDRAVPLAAPAKDRAANAPVVVALADSALAAGRYTVHWRTMARDGHAVSGTFAFTLAAAGTPAHQH